MKNPSNQLAWVPWGVGDVVRGAALIIGGSTALLVITNVLTITDVISGKIIIPLFAVLLGGGLLLVSITFGSIKYSTGLRSLGFRRPQSPGSFLLPWIALIASISFTSLYFTLTTQLDFPILEPPKESLPAVREVSLQVFTILALGLLVPISEEAFFRGFMLPAFMPRFGIWQSLIVVSALFAVCHILVAVMIPVFVSGLLLGWMYIKTKSIWPSIMTHSLQNIIVVTLGT